MFVTVGMTDSNEDVLMELEMLYGQVFLRLVRT